MMSSVMPSRKYSSSFTPLRFSKYSTATECRLGGGRRRAGPLSRGRAPAAGVQVALQADEIGLELGGGLVAQVAVLLERLLQDARRAPAARRRHLAERRRIAVEDGVEDHRRRVARERQRAGRHLVQHRAEREQVGARVGELPARLLRRHVAHRAHRRARRSSARRGARLRLASRAPRRSARCARARSWRDRSPGSSPARAR